MNQPPSKKLKSDTEPTSTSITMEKTIAVKQLLNYNIFRFLQKDHDKEILKRATLAYVFGDTGFIVTTKDDVYGVGVVNGTEDETIYTFDKSLIIVPQLCSLKIKDFVSGRNDSCFAMTEDGSVFSWGWENEWGQLGNGTKEENALPKKVGGVLEGKVVVQLAASECHVLALTKEGEIYSWGRNDKKQLGLELEDSIESVSVPTRIRSSQYGYKKIVAVACCRSGSAAISGNGELFLWGWCKGKPIESRIKQHFKKVLAVDDYFYALTEDRFVRIYLDSVELTDDIFDEKVMDFATDSKSSILVVDFFDRIGVVRDKEHDTDNIHSCKGDRSSTLESVFASYTQITYQTLKPMMRDDDVECLTNTPDQSLKNLWLDLDGDNIPKDITFLFKENHEISAHKNIIMMRSDYFKKMFNGTWKESLTNRITIGVEIEYEIFKAYLAYLYTNEISFLDSDLAEIFALMKLADSYLDIGLRRKCEKILIRTIDMENVLFLLKNARFANAQDLEQRAVKYMVDERKKVSKRWTPDQLLENLGLDAHGKWVAALCDL